MRRVSKIIKDFDTRNDIVYSERSATAKAVVAAIESRNVVPYKWNRQGTNFETYRNQFRAGVRALEMPLIEACCDHCGQQLCNRSPNCVTASRPPKIEVGCLGCGWMGWVPKDAL